MVSLCYVMSCLNQVNNGFVGSHLLAFFNIKIPAKKLIQLPFLISTVQKIQKTQHNTASKAKVKKITFPKATKKQNSHFVVLNQTTCIYTQDPIFILSNSCIISPLHSQMFLGFPQNGRNCTCRTHSRKYFFYCC